MSKKKIKWNVILKRIQDFWKRIPLNLQKFMLIIWMFLLAQWFPWGWLGDLGTYLQAGLILGAIFLVIRWLKVLEKLSEESEKKKEDKKKEDPGEKKEKKEKKKKLRLKRVTIKEYEES